MNFCFAWHSRRKRYEQTVLRLNGFDLPTKVDEAERVVLAVAAGEMSREAWTQWVQQHIVEWKA